METKKEIKIYQKQVNNIASKAEELEIKTEKQIETATDYLHQIKEASKRVKELKEGYTKPANEILKNARMMFSPLESKFKTAEMIIKDKMIEFDKRKQLESIKKSEKISEEVKKGNLDITKAGEKMQNIMPKSGYKGEEGAISYKTIKKIRIANETKIPRKYLVPNETLIRKDLLSGKKIAGVELIEEKIVASY